MARAKKIAISLDSSMLDRLDELVAAERFSSRSSAIAIAIQEKLERLDGTRLARECAKLDRREERALAEEGLSSELDEWPVY